MPAAKPGPELRSGGLLATFGLVAPSSHPVPQRRSPYAVGLDITSAYWFTSLTSFANPAVAIARSFSGTFAGIRQTDNTVVHRLVPVSDFAFGYCAVLTEPNPN
jgi:hypothetical protein